MDATIVMRLLDAGAQRSRSLREVEAA